MSHDPLGNHCDDCFDEGKTAYCKDLACKCHTPLGFNVGEAVKATARFGR